MKDMIDGVTFVKSEFIAKVKSFILLIFATLICGRNARPCPYLWLTIVTLKFCWISQGVLASETDASTSEYFPVYQLTTAIFTIVIAFVIFGLYSLVCCAVKRYKDLTLHHSLQVEDTSQGKFYLEAELVLPHEPNYEYRTPLPHFSHSEPSSKLEYYNIKPENIETFAPFGKGYVVIVTNFTGQLKGYNSDAELITRFFEVKLKYTVTRFKNLSKSQFKQMINATQGRLQTENYDRFFLFVLSHGNERGIMMCKEGNSVQRDVDENGFPLTVSIDYLTKKFSHDLLPSMKDYPKCIFTQMCMGNVRVKAAIDVIHDEEEDMVEEDTVTGPQDWFSVGREPSDNSQQDINPIAVSESLSNFTPIGSDILLGYSSDKGTLSWVTENGSWYIQEMITVFYKHYKTETLVDMLTAVNCQVGKKAGVQAENGKEIYPVYQLPTMSDYLSKKFYLKLPSHRTG